MAKGGKILISKARIGQGKVKIGSSPGEVYLLPTVGRRISTSTGQIVFFAIATAAAATAAAAQLKTLKTQEEKDFLKKSRH